MCGIAGLFYAKVSATTGLIDKTVKSMCDQMRTRGPDAEGFYVSEKRNVCLGHRRLSIQDIHPRANQPMSLSSKKYTIVFNGEIYNFEGLKRDLIHQGVVFETGSDTEVLLKLFEVEGVSMFPKLRGMYSLAIWDNERQKILLARDPYGIKPLYFAKFDGGVIFASQVKAVLSSNLVSEELSEAGVSSFFLFGSVLEPNTWFSEINPVPPGTWCVIDELGQVSEPCSFFDIGDVWRNASPSEVSSRQLYAAVRECLTETVQNHLIADVPIGLFLSGGVDSGVLAGISSQFSSEVITGVTISFSEFLDSQDDEVPDAKRMAELYGMKHYVRSFSREEFEESLSSIFKSMDQPSIDGVNTWFASKAASEAGLKVILSGVGGDELFSGYSSFSQIPNVVQLSKLMEVTPFGKQICHFASSLLHKKTKNKKWLAFCECAKNYHGAYWLKRGLFDVNEAKMQMKKLGVISDPKICPEQMIDLCVTHLASNGNLAVGQLESSVYLRNQLLRDADWASMAHAVEVRTPFVDTFLLQQLQPYLGCFKKSKGKKLLAASPNKPLPDEILNKRKTGFSIPLGSWVHRSEKRNMSLKASSKQTSRESMFWAEKVASSIYVQQDK